MILPTCQNENNFLKSDINYAKIKHLYGVGFDF